MIDTLPTLRGRESIQCVFSSQRMISDSNCLSSAAQRNKWLAYICNLLVFLVATLWLPSSALIDNFPSDMSSTDPFSIHCAF